jgi:hypothetical protein
MSLGDNGGDKVRIWWITASTAVYQLLCYQPANSSSSVKLYAAVLTVYNQPQRLVLFENFNQHNPSSIANCDPIRIPQYKVSEAAAAASINLESFAAAFFVDASYFFQARQSSWTWPNMTSLALTSRLLKPNAIFDEVDNMLRDAAAAAIKMPSLRVMEIWNGRRGVAVMTRVRMYR